MFEGDDGLEFDWWPDAFFYGWDGFDWLWPFVLLHG
jgi:hypothetical protein